MYMSHMVRACEIVNLHKNRIFIVSLGIENLLDCKCQQLGPVRYGSVATLHAITSQQANHMMITLDKVHYLQWRQTLNWSKSDGLIFTVIIVLCAKNGVW